MAAILKEVQYMKLYQIKMEVIMKKISMSILATLCITTVTSQASEKNNATAPVQQIFVHQPQTFSYQNNAYILQVTQHIEIDTYFCVFIRQKAPTTVNYFTYNPTNTQNLDLLHKIIENLVQNSEQPIIPWLMGTLGTSIKPGIAPGILRQHITLFAQDKTKNSQLLAIKYLVNDLNLQSLDLGQAHLIETLPINPKQITATVQEKILPIAPEKTQNKKTNFITKFRRKKPRKRNNKNDLVLALKKKKK